MQGTGAVHRWRQTVVLFNGVNHLEETGWRGKAWVVIYSQIEITDNPNLYTTLKSYSNYNYSLSECYYAIWLVVDITLHYKQNTNLTTFSVTDGIKHIPSVILTCSCLPQQHPHQHPTHATYKHTLSLKRQLAFRLMRPSSPF